MSIDFVIWDPQGSAGSAKDAWVAFDKQQAAGALPRYLPRTELLKSFLTEVTDLLRESGLNYVATMPNLVDGPGAAIDVVETGPFIDLSFNPVAADADRVWDLMRTKAEDMGLRIYDPVMDPVTE